MRHTLISTLIAWGAIAAAATAAAAPAAPYPPADTVTIATALLPEPMKVTVACPEGDGPFPTLYLLNGYGGSYRNWPRFLVDIDSVARAHDMVVVCPSGMNSWYWDSPEQPDMQMESFFTRELVAAIDSLYPTIPDRDARAITGFSMGGHGALWLAMRHPDIWGHAGATSGGVDIRPFPGSWKMATWLGERDSVPDVWDAHTVRTLADTLPDSVLRSLDIFFDCGTDDFFYTVNCQLDSVLSARRIPHTFATYPGAHTAGYWSRSIHPQIDHFSRKLATSRPSAPMTRTFDSPRMTLFLPDPATATGQAVICCPGGGYSKVATDHEGNAWAPFLNSLGIALAVVDYSLPDGNPDLPLADIARAYDILADSAARWHIDPARIGIMGASAGGHLASTVATRGAGRFNPAFQILFYPVISLDNSITHQGTRRGFLGAKPSGADVKRWSSDRAVTEATPAAFIVLSGDDRSVDPANSLAYYSALRAHDVPAEMIIFPDGGHGWGFNPESAHHLPLLSALAAFLAR